MKSKKKGKNSIKYDYIQEFKYWQENQYNPGYYLGSKLSFFFTKPWKPKLLGLFWITSSIAYLVLLAFIVVNALKSKSIFKDANFFFFLIFIILFGGVLSLQLIAGIRKLRKQKRK